jgi:hypothetical protein
MSTVFVVSTAREYLDWVNVEGKAKVSARVCGWSDGNRAAILRA